VIISVDRMLVDAALAVLTVAFLALSRHAFSCGGSLEHLPESAFAEPSGDACDHYHLYPHDIHLLGELGFNTYRFSLEWFGHFAHPNVTRHALGLLL
jgi:hypothetical protein